MTRSTPGWGDATHAAQVVSTTARRLLSVRRRMSGAPRRPRAQVDLESPRGRGPLDEVADGPRDVRGHEALHFARIGGTRARSLPPDLAVHDDVGNAHAPRAELRREREGKAAQGVLRRRE